MALEASRRALESARLPVSAVDLLVLATSTPDFPFPGTALFVQELLGLTECQVIELRAGCSGMAQAFVIAEQFIAAGRAEVALVIGSEMITPFNQLLGGDPGSQKGDLVARAMFGDGAGAVVMVPCAERERGILGSMCRSVGGDRAPGMVLRTGGAAAPAGLTGPAGGPAFTHDFQAIVKHAPELAARAMDWVWKSDLVPKADITWYVPPQVSGHMIETVRSRTDLGGAGVFSNFAEVGNTASASIYIALDAMRRGGHLERGDILALLPAEATKWTFGAIVLRW
jgi:3-oxoacyl-[acyl-carrier-protein] synthase-3